MREPRAQDPQASRQAKNEAGSAYYLRSPQFAELKLEEIGKASCWAVYSWFKRQGNLTGGRVEKRTKDLLKESRFSRAATLDALRILQNERLIESLDYGFQVVGLGPELKKRSPGGWTKGPVDWTKGPVDWTFSDSSPYIRNNKEIKEASNAPPLPPLRPDPPDQLNFLPLSLSDLPEDPFETFWRDGAVSRGTKGKARKAWKTLIRSGLWREYSETEAEFAIVAAQGFQKYFNAVCSETPREPGETKREYFSRLKYLLHESTWLAPEGAWLNWMENDEPEPELDTEPLSEEFLRQYADLYPGEGLSLMEKYLRHERELERKKPIEIEVDGDEFVEVDPLTVLAELGEKQ